MISSLKHPILLHLISVLIVMTSLVGWKELHLNKDLLAIFPKDNPEVKAMQNIKTEFENGGRVLLLLEADTSNKDQVEVSENLASEADSLAAYLNNSEYTYAVLHKPLWEQDKLILADFLAYLWINGEEKEVQKLSENISHHNLQKTIEASIEELSYELDPAALSTLSLDPLGLMQQKDLKRLLERADQTTPDTPTESKKQNNAGNSQDDLFTSVNGKIRLLIVYPANSNLSSGAWCRELKHLVREWKQSRDEASLPIKVDFTGGPAFASEIASKVKRDIIVTVLISSLFSGLVFWFLIRNNKLIHFQILLVASILLVTYGLGSLCIGSLSLMSVGFASILIGLAVDYGMIICVEAKKASNIQVLRKAVTKPIIFSSLSTAAVFASLCYSKLPGIQELGFLVATGILFSAFVLLVYNVPVAYKKGSKSRDTHPPLQENPRDLVKGRKEKPQLWAKPLLFCLMLALLIPFFSKSIPQVTFDLHVMTSSDSAAKQTLDKLKNHFPGSFEDDDLSLLIQCNHPQELIKKIKGIDDPNQSIALALYPTSSRQKNNAKQLQSVVAMKKEILKSLQTNGFKDDALRLNAQVLQNIEHYLEILNTTNTVFIRHPLAVAWMRSFMFFHKGNNDSSQDRGGILLKVNQKKWSNTENRQLIQSGAIQATSWGQIEDSISKQIPKDLIKVLLFVAVATFIMLYAAIQNLKETTVGILCLVSPIAIVSYIVEASTLHWNFLNIFSIPLLLGLGVDYVIHMVFAHKRSLQTGCETRSYIRKTLLCCGSTSVVGFLALGASSNQAFVSLGILCGGGVILTMLFCLLLMPYLLNGTSGN